MSIASEIQRIKNNIANKLNFNFSTPASLIFCLLILLAVKTVS